MSMKLSKYFTLDEFTYSRTAIKEGIDNSIPKPLINNSRWFCQTVLDVIREEFGAVKISSGYRSPELCEAIGSFKSSNHITGYCADLKFYRDVRFVDVLKFIKKQNIAYKELIAEYFPYGWIHLAVSPKTEENRNITKVHYPKKGYKYEKKPLEEIIKLYD